MDSARTTLSVQRYLDELATLDGDALAEPLIRELIARSANRLRVLCGSLLHRSYGRLTRPPLNLETDEMLSALVERLIKALREVRPTNVRQFFALANQHMRWELNDLARLLDARSPAIELHVDLVPAPASSASQLSLGTQRILSVIDALPDEEREVFDLVRIQGLSHAEAAEVLDVSTKTVQRRLNRSLVSLSEQLGDLLPGTPSPRDTSAG